MRIRAFFFLLLGGLCVLSFSSDTAKAEENTDLTTVLETAKLGKADEVRQLVQRKDILKSEDVQGNNALMLAARYNKDVISVKTLSKADFDIFKKNIDGDNALTLSLENPDIRNFQNMVRLYTVGGKLNGGEELLHKAIIKKADTEHLQSIISAKVNVNAADAKGRTPLMMAIIGKADGKVIKFLLSNKADVNASDSMGRTVLMYAAFTSDDEDVIKMLLDNGADIRATDKDGKSALSYALYNDNIACLRQLQKVGLKRLQKDYEFIISDNVARLYFVKTANDTELAKVIRMKADFKVKDKENRTALMYAAKYNPNAAVITTLINEGIDINSTDDKGMTALDYAEENPNANRIKEELVKYGALVTDKPFDMSSEASVQRKLFEYAKTGTDTEVELILADKSSVTAKDSYGKTALMIAAEYNQNPAVTEVLLRTGSDVNLKDNGGYTPLMLAARSNPNPQVMKVLLASGAKTFETYKGNTTLLMLAAENNPSKEVMSFLLSLGYEVNAADFNGKTALYFAARKPNVTAVKELLSADANVKVLPDDKIKELLKIAIDYSDKELLSLLLNAGVKPEFPIDETKTLFMYALENSDSDTIKLLIKNKADVNYSFKGNYPLFSALESSNAEAVEILLKEKANTAVANSAGETPFTISIKKNFPLSVSEALWNKDKNEITKALWQNIGSVDKERLSFLVLKGADLKSKNKDGKTILAEAVALNPDADVIEVLLAKCPKAGAELLSEAVKNPSIRILELLLPNSQNLNIRDRESNTPLMLAASMGKFDFVKALISAGANVRGRNMNGKTALHLAAENPDSTAELLSLLAENGINVNLADYEKDTPLSLAVKTNADYENFAALIGKGAKTKTIFGGGNTLLMLAARYNQDIRIVKYLVEDGLTLNARNKERKTALDYAKNNKNTDIQAFLIKSGAK